MKIQHIAVSTDFSDESRRTFPIVRCLARKFSSTLSVVHLADFPPSDMKYWPKGAPLFGAKDMDQLLDVIEKQLSDLVAAEPAFEGLDVHPRLLRYGGLEAYDEFLGTEGVDLLVVATHGRSGSSRLLLGSFAEKVLRTVHVPVLVCRTRAVTPIVPPEEGFRLRRVLTLTDFSPSGAPALREAAAWSRSFEAKVRLLHVIEHDPGLYGYCVDAFAGWIQYQEQIQQECQGKLRRALQAELAGLDAEVRIRTGRPHIEILTEAEEYAADMIVIGSHGRTGWERFLMGSVAEGVVRKAPCPVLVVRGPNDAASPK